LAKAVNAAPLHSVTAELAPAFSSHPSFWALLCGCLEGQLTNTISHMHSGEG